MWTYTETEKAMVTENHSKSYFLSSLLNGQEHDPSEDFWNNFHAQDGAVPVQGTTLANQSLENFLV